MKQSESRFLNTPHGAYYNRGVPSEDVELTHVGPGSMGGEYLRRFWQPVAHSDEVNDLPVRLQIMGEDLVVFRDGSNNVGVLELHCTHRGTSLEFGLVETKGIRCCYHGWLFDVDGRILEMPAEPPDSTYKDRLCQGAYPTHEYKGLIFVYMGPPDLIPPFPRYDAFEVPGYRITVGTKNVKHCNWLQVMDNVVDPVHEVFLHARVSNIHFTDPSGRLLTELADIGEFDFVETPVGIMCVEARRVEGDIWTRIIELICPNIAQVAPPPNLPPTYQDGKQLVCVLPRIFRWRVPQDDFNTLEFTFVRVPEDEEDEYTKNPGFATQVQLAGRDRPYEERQRYPGDYEAQVGQRPIARHALEHLATTDRGVIMYRNIIRQSIRALEKGDDPKGLVRGKDEIIPTYGNDTVTRVPRASDNIRDAQLVRDTGLGLAQGYLKTPPAVVATDQL